MPERTCVQCGRVFRAGSNLTGNPCRTIDRECVTCGKRFRGRERECYQCKAADQSCKVCGKIFRGIKRTCEDCRATERLCANCGCPFRGTKNTCPSCAPVERTCACGKRFRGTALACQRCSAIERECAVCHEKFLGARPVCRSCRVTTRRCETCDRYFRGDQAECRTCRTIERPCITCGQVFRSAYYLECLTCSGRASQYNARRRIRRLAAQIDGPLPRRTYRKILTSGPCVYCGQPATCLDHVRPLSRGGEEAERNLVAACERCNKRKGFKLLTEWDPERVAHAAQRSQAVTAELARISALDNPAEGWVVLPDS